MHWHMLIGDTVEYTTYPAYDLQYQSIDRLIDDFINVAREMILSGFEQHYFDQQREIIAKSLVDNVGDSVWVVANTAVKMMLSPCLVDNCVAVCQN